MSNVNTSLTIANGASQSDAIRLNGSALVGIELPAAWTTANLTLLASNDNSTFNPVYDSAGTEVTITAAASRYVVLQPGLFFGMEWLKLRSGTAGTPVNQGADRVIKVTTDEM